ncbi:hypothetical protein J6590_058881 [Homalodisca vitripennis]|nr:hypothetical protein J6590_058881 [Homalodisca vitripennis]
MQITDVYNISLTINSADTQALTSETTRATHTSHTRQPPSSSRPTQSTGFNHKAIAFLNIPIELGTDQSVDQNDDKDGDQSITISPNHKGPQGIEAELAS